MKNQILLDEYSKCQSAEGKGTYLNESKLQWLIQQAEFPKDVYDKLQVIIKESILDGTTNDDDHWMTQEIADFIMGDWTKETMD